MIESAYIILSTSYSGVIETLYLTDNVNDAIKKREEIIESMARREQVIFGGDVETIIDDIKDDFCIQEWNGKSFKCICKKVGIEIRTPEMFHWR